MTDFSFLILKIKTLFSLMITLINNQRITLNACSLYNGSIILMHTR